MGSRAESQDIWDWLFQWEAEAERAILALLLDIWALATTPWLCSAVLGKRDTGLFRGKRNLYWRNIYYSGGIKRFLSPLYWLWLGLDEMSLSSAEKEQLATYVKIPAALPLPWQSIWKNLSFQCVFVSNGFWSMTCFIDLSICRRQPIKVRFST